MQQSQQPSTNLGVSQLTFAWIWTTIGVAVLYFSFNSVLHIQGSKFYLPGLNLEKVERYSSTLVAIPVVIVGVLLILYLTVLGVSRSAPRGVVNRLPMPCKLEINRSGRLGKAVLWAAYAGFILVPVASLVLLLRKLYYGTGFSWDGGKRIAVEFEHFTTFVPLSGHMYRFGDSANGFEYFPGLQHWIYFLLGISTLLYFLYVQYLLSFNLPGTSERAASAPIEEDG